jgi:hypothetical protein
MFKSKPNLFVSSVNNMSWQALSSTLGFVTANFAFQFFTNNNYKLALDRSFFQVIAIWGFWYCLVIFTGDE